MIGGSWCEQTDIGLGVVPDSFPQFERELRASRGFLCVGNQVYLPSEPAANAAWWHGDGRTTSDIRLHRALSSVRAVDITTLPYEEGFVLELPGPASAAVFPRPNEWALADPADLWDTGNVPIWSQPIPIEPDFQEFEGLSGGW